MKKTSKLLLLFATLGMLIGCNGKSKDKKPDPTPSGGDEPGEVTTLLNVIYFNSYVSEGRANEIKTGLVEALVAGGEQVTANQFNFFQSRNSKVAGLGEEILDYNEENPTQTIDVLLGANNFNAWDDAELKAQFDAKYENDGEDYTYGTHATLSNNNNRKFFYDKAKANDKYVKALQSYLREHYQGGDDEPLPETSVLNVAVYGHYVTEERADEIKEGFEAYCTTNNIVINELGFAIDLNSTTITEFASVIVDNNTVNPSEKIDIILGVKADSEDALKNAGYAMSDKTDYNYGTTEGKENDRRLWIDPNSPNLANIRHFEAYLKANWVPGAEPVNHYYLTGSFNEWATTGLTQELLKVEDNHYRISNVEFAADVKFKVYSPEETKYYSNDSTWADCGFTLDEDKNIIVSSQGTYTIDLHLDGLNNNFVTLEKQAAPKTNFVLGIYDKFVSTTRAAAIKEGVETYFADNEINADVIPVNLGSGNIGPTATAISNYNTAHSDNPIDVVVGLKQDKDDAIKDINYEIGEVNYTYGDAGGADNDRKITVLTASKTRAEYLAFKAYMDANWLFVPEIDYYLIGSFTEWNVETLTYKLTKVTTGQYKYENLELVANSAFKVFVPGEEPTYFTNESTWADCGFTLGENNNIVVTNGGYYTINFFVEGQNNNHVTIEKTADLPTASYYLVGSFNDWNQDDTTYELKLESEGVFKLPKFTFAAADQFKVLKVEGTTKTLYSNSTTWENCGFTLTDDDYKNIVVTEAGVYAVRYYVNGENNNFVTIKQLEKETFVLGIYDKFVTAERASTIEQAFEAAYVTDDSYVDVVLANLGDGNIAACATAITTYNDAHTENPIDVVLGLKQDNKDSIKNINYEIGSVNYSYGDNGGAANDRKITVLPASKTKGVYTAFVAFMDEAYPVNA